MCVFDAVSHRENSRLLNCAEPSSLKLVTIAAPTSASTQVAEVAWLGKGMPGMSCCGGGCDHLARGLPMHPVLAKAQAALASAAPSEAAPAGPDKDLVTACEHVLR